MQYLLSHFLKAPPCPCSTWFCTQPSLTQRRLHLRRCVGAPNIKQLNCIPFHSAQHHLSSVLTANLISSSSFFLELFSLKLEIQIAWSVPRSPSEWPGSGRRWLPLEGKGSHYKESTRVWMKIAAAHHQWLIKAILLFTALIEDALWFPWRILTVKSSESFSKCLKRSLGYKVQAPSYCRVIQFFWTTWSHSSNAVSLKSWRGLWSCP